MGNGSRHRVCRLAVIALVALVAAPFGCGGDGAPPHDAAAEGTYIDAGGPAELCAQTGGTVGTQLCCGSVTDFPDTCGVGNCGCSPSSSHEVQVCTCAAGKCFSADKGCRAP